MNDTQVSEEKSNADLRSSRNEGRLLVVLAGVALWQWHGLMFDVARAVVTVAVAVGLLAVVFPHRCRRLVRAAFDALDSGRFDAAANKAAAAVTGTVNRVRFGLPAAVQKHVAWLVGAFKRLLSFDGRKHAQRAKARKAPKRPAATRKPVPKPAASKAAASKAAASKVAAAKTGADKVVPQTAALPAEDMTVTVSRKPAPAVSDEPSDEAGSPQVELDAVSARLAQMFGS